VDKLKEAEPKRARLTGPQTQLVIACAMRRNRGHGVLLATAILAGGGRASEITHLRWRNANLKDGILSVPESKTEAGVRDVFLEPELVQLLRAHRLASKWSQPEDYVFPGRFRDRPRDRNSMRTRVLYPAVREANKILADRDEPLIPCDKECRVTFHGLRFTYAGIRAELGEHPSITAKQIGHRDERMTLRIYTDVTGVRPKTRMAGLLEEGREWTGTDSQTVSGAPAADVSSVL
jgi:integrase